MVFFEIDKKEYSSPWNMFDMHSHQNYELCFLLEGKRNFFIDSELYIVESPSLFVLSPFSLHKTEGGPYLRININLSKNFFLEKEQFLIDYFVSKRALSFDKVLAAKVSVMLEEIYKLKDAYTKQQKALLQICIKALLCEIYRFRPKAVEPYAKIKKKNSHSSVVILNIINYINENYSQNLSLKKLSDMFFVSPNHISRLFKSSMGKTISEYILELRLNKAKQLLSTTNLTVSDISAKCAFCSVNYFEIVFKNYIGMSPTKYRKKAI